MTHEDIRTAERFLASQDELLGQLISLQKIDPPMERGDYFTSLCRSIIGQQVSVAAARAIFDRFATQTGLDPTKVASLDETAIKTIGLSKQKASYIQDLARHFVDDPQVYTHLDTQDDQQIIAELTAVKGIGVWTAQMFLIFTLGRPDVFAPDDIGLQRGLQKLYGWEVMPKRAELMTLTEKWQPYRTVASLHLWRSLDATPGE